MNAKRIAACRLGPLADAESVDQCFDSSGLAFVAKRFRIPALGPSRSFEGQSQATATITHGLACMRSDGTALRVQTTTQINPPSIEWDHSDLADQRPRPVVRSRPVRGKPRQPALAAQVSQRTGIRESGR